MSPAASTEAAPAAAGAAWALDAPAGKAADRDLKGRTVRSALVSTVAQGAGLVLRTGAIVLLSRLLSPRDFGLVAMATTLTGFLSLFRDFGLSTASVQRADVTEAQASTLFWINLAAGGALAALCAASAPALVGFYNEPRLLLITIVLSIGFLLNGATLQHRALLQRQMRFLSLAVIDTGGLVFAVAASVALALAGLGPWAVVSMALCPQVGAVIGVWTATRWVPGKPRRGTGVRPMLQYGGTLTVNTFVVYAAYNADKVLLGRFWGADALGLYSRAYQLLSLAAEGLNSAVSPVALPALARLQNDPERCRRYFAFGFGTFMALAVPLFAACGIFADDIVRVFLGPQWMEAAPIFRLLTPALFVVALINPLAWLMLAFGRMKRSLSIALLIAPVTIAGVALGLPYGPETVALGFSGAMVLLAAPCVLWARRGMPPTGRDILGQLVPALTSAALAAIVAVAAARAMIGIAPLLRLTIETAVFLAVFAAALLFGFGRWAVYSPLVRDVLRPRRPGQPA